MVVGAILGDIAQLVGDAIPRSREKQARVRDGRLEAYTEFMATATTAIEPSTAGRVATAEENAALSRPQLILWEEHLTATRDALHRLSVLVGRVEL